MLPFVLVGGALGTLARWGLQSLVQARTGITFPWGTLAVNLLGSFALGLVMRLADAPGGLSPQVRAGLSIGFCGAFTTMSTFAFDTWGLLAGQDYPRAAAYVGLSLAGSVTAVIAGMALAGRIA